MTTLAPSTPQPAGRDQMEIEIDFAHFDFDPERCDGWPLPAPRKFVPNGETKAETKSWRENLRALVERVKL